MMKNLKTAAFFLIIVLSALILDFGMQGWVEKIAVRFIGKQELTVRLADTEYNHDKKMQIFFGGSSLELFEDLKEASDESWTYAQGETGVSWTELETDMPGAEIHIKVKPSPEKFMIFGTAPYDGIAEVVCGGKTQMIDTNREEGVEITRVYPFQKFQPAYGFRIIVHILLFAIFFVFLCVCLKKILTIDIKGAICIKSVIYLSLLSLFFVGGA